MNVYAYVYVYMYVWDYMGEHSPDGDGDDGDDGSGVLVLVVVMTSTCHTMGGARHLQCAPIHIHACIYTYNHDFYDFWVAFCKISLNHLESKQSKAILSHSQPTPDA